MITLLRSYNLKSILILKVIGMYIFYFCLTFFLVLIDFISKMLVEKYLKHRIGINIIKNVLGFRYIENTGAAFGILKNQRFFFVIITIIAFFFVGYCFFASKKNQINKTALVFVFAGTLGNFLDRIFKGYVIDFIDILPTDFPIFNFADVFLVSGLFALGLDFFRKEFYSK